MASSVSIAAPTSGRRHKKSRKHGQNKKKPCHLRYTADRRWLHNKAKRIKKNNSKVDYESFCLSNGLPI